MTVVVLVVVAFVVQVVVVVVVLVGRTGRGFVVVAGGCQLYRGEAPQGKHVVQDRSEPVFCCTVLLAVLSLLMEW